MDVVGRFRSSRERQSDRKFAAFAYSKGDRFSDGPLPLPPLAVFPTPSRTKLTQEEYHARHAGRRLVFPKNTRFRTHKRHGRKGAGVYIGANWRPCFAGRRSFGIARAQAAGGSDHGAGGGRLGPSNGVERERLCHTEATGDSGRENHG